MPNYYNENDPKAAAWLRQLIKEGLIPKGMVDERSITEVQAADFVGFTQYHFFAGIGGWSLALRLAGWPEDREIVTGSCPCQPYSDAGEQKGNDDERNLWPDMFRIVKGMQRKPVTIIGEQVEAAIRFGWLDGISTDLEGEGYAVGAVVLGAHSVGAPHIRQRLYWVADSSSHRWAQHVKEQGQREATSPHHTAEHNGTSGVAITGSTERRRGPKSIGQHGQSLHTANRSEVIRMGESIQQRLEGHAGHGNGWSESKRHAAEAAGSVATASNTMWDQSQWHECRDGKARRIPIEPALFPLADGIPGRVGLLRGAGNAIVPALAAEFIKAYMQATGVA